MRGEMKEAALKAILLGLWTLAVWVASGWEYALSQKRTLSENVNSCVEGQILVLNNGDEYACMKPNAWVQRK